MPRTENRGRKSRASSAALQGIAEELTAIAVRHLDTLAPEEREQRIKALEKRFPAKKRVSSYAIPQRREQTPENRLSARGRGE